ncbi:uncharacterized protein [Fopius arisanus]|uniref:Uncharacterized protein n=1 Tax=Fopius arisanus TaxID=64838 RepID=A0A9R1T515_9HYME|nr:PREDICTED: uncharacterized protein LOC105266388 [Fopius arisanus]
MALSLAIALAGLKVEDFSTLLTHLKSDHDLHDGRSSPSTRSDSSGVSSLEPSSRYTTATSTPFSSRPGTPNDDQNIIGHDLPKVPWKKVSVIGSGRKNQKKCQDTKEKLLSTPEHQEETPKRDILDLMSNIKYSEWSIRHPDVYTSSVRNFMENRSVYFRLSDDALLEDYPVRECKPCNFREPSPYLCK